MKTLTHLLNQLWAKPIFRTICMLLLALALILGSKSPLAADAFEVCAFHAEHRELASHSSFKQLKRCNEMKPAFRDLLPDKHAVLVKDHLTLWKEDDGHHVAYEALVRLDNGLHEVVVYEIDDVLTNTVTAYYHGIIQTFPSDLGFNRENLVVISFSDPNYANYASITPEQIQQELLTRVPEVLICEELWN